ncbi:MAG: hypothetical protein R3185_00135 [Candidatus Thermoplasmatota archaeon]|nr:hypothetical protein [Candidatus Thermoplasmatota archaeon]
MAWWTWTLVGLGVVVLILALSMRINRKKATADLALRLAEAYRARGQFEVAERLYRVPGELDQNREEAREGLDLAEAQHRRPPVLELGLVEAGERALAEDRGLLEEVFAQHGLQVELPPLADP